MILIVGGEVKKKITGIHEGIHVMLDLHNGLIGGVDGSGVLMIMVPRFIMEVAKLILDHIEFLVDLAIDVALVFVIAIKHFLVQCALRTKIVIGMKKLAIGPIGGIAMAIALIRSQRRCRSILRGFG